MDSPPAHMTPESGRAGLALIFTDARGRVVFTDANFLSLTCHPDAISLVGEPLHKVLEVDQPDVGNLIQEIARAGFVRGHELEICRATGNPLRVTCAGVATYDDQGTFIGADLTLRDASQAEPAAAQMADHGDVLAERIRQIEAHTASEAVREEQAFAQDYFTAQVTAVQVLLGRLGGPRVHQMVETLVNQAAARQGWPVQLQGGQLTFGEEDMPLDVYSSLQAQVIDYAVSVVGQQAVAREMRAMDDRVSARLREAAGKAGLRRWLDGA